MDHGKENRPPSGMVVEGKGKITPGKHTPGRITPGRMRKKTQDQYFDVGKVGRKTGITLPDNGIRDEHGMEPMSGIFDSPIASPQRHADRTLTSSDMHVQESSAPEINDTLYSRKTPKFPPPRASTPKHTNLGSPKRMSIGRQPHTTGKALLPRDEDERSPAKALSRTQPPPNRLLDFAGNNVRPSIEITSPFKPRRALRRSIIRQDPFASPKVEVRKKPRSESVAEALRTVEETAQLLWTDDAPVMLEDDPYEPIQHVPSSEIDAELESDNAGLAARRSRRSTNSDSPAAASRGSRSPSVVDVTPTKKRDRSSMESVHSEDDATAARIQLNSASDSPAQKKQRSKPRLSETVLIHDDDEPHTIDPSLLSHGGRSLTEDSREPSAPPPKKSKGKGKATALQDRDPNRPTKPPGSPMKLKDAPARSSKSPSKRASSRGVSIGPGSNFNLRATTPFDDAISTSRFGRPVIKPLQYWANESRVWKNGECEGIIRADEIVKPKPKAKKRSKKRKKTQGASKLGDIDEENETESTCPDEWEENLGVISGTMANWDPATQMGNSSDPIKEDLAFAQRSIITRDVAGSEFKYAKIMTLPFFGAGLVELPPEGFKRTKNSRKMQMCFFVHEGKVLVDIGAQGMRGEINSFAVSKGGVWVVPRGNNYGITNVSRTKTAKIFFAQGCEVDSYAGAAVSQ